MTRSASPNGAVEFSYDFPVAGPSHLPTTPTRPIRTPRTRSPTRPHWEAASSYEDNMVDDEIDYDAFGYPRVAHRAATVPTPTRNQWRAPSPTLYPYADAYSAYPYAAPLPLLLAPAPSSSCESDSSALSSCARSCHSQKSSSKREHAKIRKPRRSVDEDSAPAPSSFTYTTSLRAPSPQSSPYFSSFSDSTDSFEDEEEPEQEQQQQPQEQDKENCSHSLRRQWDALSLRVRFGVFRAKRRMRKRVMSL